MRIFENELRGKTVMSEEGTYLGVLRNSIVDEKTGKLLEILVEPSEEIDLRLYHINDEGYLVFPFDSIKSIKDVVIISS